MTAIYDYLVEWYIVPNHAPQTVDDGRQSDGPGGVTVPIHLVASASEVKEGTSLKPTSTVVKQNRKLLTIFIKQ